MHRVCSGCPRGGGQALRRVGWPSAKEVGQTGIPGLKRSSALGWRFEGDDGVVREEEFGLLRLKGQPDDGLGDG